MATKLFTYNAKGTRDNPGSTTSGHDKLGAGGQLEPGSYGGDINVVTGWPWTLTPPSSPALDEVPYVWMKEYLYLESQMRAEATTSLALPKGLAAAATDGVSSSPYDKLYDHDNPTNFSYTFPYFDNTAYSTTNTWQEVSDEGLVGGLIKEGAGALEGLGSRRGGKLGRLMNLGGKAIGQASDKMGLVKDLAFKATSPSAKAIDKPKLWVNGEARSLSISFPLYNTIVTGKEQNYSDIIQKNWELCYLLTYQNLFNKRTYFTNTPPVFYEVVVPGVHYSKASYVSNLKITHAGNIRSMKFDWLGNGSADYNIPDAYIVNITLQDMLVNSKNLFNVVGNPQVTASKKPGSTSGTGSGSGSNPGTVPSSPNVQNINSPGGVQGGGGEFGGGGGGSSF
jgi:uncharacterized membrane protein YgcG